MPTFDNWTYSLDREATVKAYQAVSHGGAETCDCAGCRNFVLARATVFPVSFLALLDYLGIDCLKDGEAYHNGRISPGRHDYGGWFHFIGTLHETGDFPPAYLDKGFSVWMCRASAPRLSSLRICQSCNWSFTRSPYPGSSLNRSTDHPRPVGRSGGLTHEFRDAGYPHPASPRRAGIR